MKLLSKRNIIIAVSVLLVLVISASLLIIQPWNKWSATELTEKKRAELIDEIEKRENGMLTMTTGTGNYVGRYDPYYYGTINGYDVLFEQGQTFGVSVKRIGEEVFVFQQGFCIRLYRNGKWALIEDAYSEHLINDVQLRLIAKAHYDHVGLDGLYEELGFADRYKDM